MDRLETRELAYFVAVAEELHFGRAAARIGIEQPPLSRTISKLERRVGTMLLRRTSRSVTLTPAGEALLHEAHHVLEATDAALRRSQRAGAAGRRLPVAMKPGGDAGLLPEILRVYEADPAAVPVEPLVCGIGEQAIWLRDGRADAAFLHLPYDDDVRGLDVEPLCEERQVAVLPRAHLLAGRAAVSLEDLRGESLPRWPGTAPGEGAAGPEVRDSAQLMQLIALGEVVAVLPESVVPHLRRDLTAVLVGDAPPTTVAVAWPERSTSRAVAAFVGAAGAVAGRREQPARPLLGRAAS